MNSRQRTQWAAPAAGIRLVGTVTKMEWVNPHANGRDLTLPDGRKLFLGSSGTGAPYDPDHKDRGK